LLRSSGGRKKFDALIPSYKARQAIEQITINPSISNQEVLVKLPEGEKDTSKQNGCQTRYINPNKIPGLKGYTVDTRGRRSFSNNPLQFRMLWVWKKVYNHTDAWPFRQPVDPKHAPGYFDVIKDPIDLQTIKSNLDSGKYQETGWEGFDEDFRRMIKNCQHFNAPNTPYHKMAAELSEFYDTIITGTQTPTIDN